MAKIEEAGLQDLYEFSVEEITTELRDTVEPNDSVLDQAAEELVSWAAAITEGFLRIEDVAQGVGYVQIAPYKPIPVAEIFARMADLGQREAAEKLRTFLDSATRAPELALAVPPSSRPS